MPKTRDLLIPDPCKPEEKKTNINYNFTIANENEGPTKVRLIFISVISITSEKISTYY